MVDTTRSNPDSMIDFSAHRYIVDAEVESKTGAANWVVFLSHDDDNTARWTQDIFSSLVCYETELDNMKHLVDIGIELAEFVSDNLVICINVRPVLLTADLLPCYSEYLEIELSKSKTELMERFEKEFSREEQSKILSHFV